MIREWDIKRTTFSLADFLSWQRAGSLELSPSFQRRSVWTKAQKSYFVDTVYRGLPVPIIFVRERTDVETLSTVREVIDGQQRLRTMLAFVDPKCLADAADADNFTVQKKHNKDLQGKLFSTLGADAKKRILSYQLSTHVLPNDTSDSEVLSIFARMNSTGSKLNEQELRNAEYFGEFKIASYDTAFANLNRWRSWKLFSEQDMARMKEVEFTSLLFILIMNGIFERTQSLINRFYKLHDDNFDDWDRVIKEFNRVMDAIEDAFGDGLRSTVYSNTAMFLQLFHLIRRLENAGISLTHARIRRILDVGDQIKDRSGLPENVLVALASRFNRLSNQQIVSDYIFNHASK
ncbi:DUF262 domain-containing protein [Sphingomonas qomolangmaensis]|uniref:DUF262 domain-containing protein n=1 Tax=Sphingomonas qomolangmaensis TaxID=2918765 RepID=A0ABY5L4H3_9SPHN|nr:DUF262 domain-containing protein [Sphingomonas qomolangmaensis]UUL81702.1 DUF262 domain-containing protein [Sphingomonas qomolangmaensis]